MVDSMVVMSVARMVGSLVAVTVGPLVATKVEWTVLMLVGLWAAKSAGSTAGH